MPKRQMFLAEYRVTPPDVAVEAQLRLVTQHLSRRYLHQRITAAVRTTGCCPNVPGIFLLIDGARD